jgi:hypothetical protein
MFKSNRDNTLTRILVITLGFALTISLSPLLSTAHLQAPAGNSLPVISDVLTND